MGLAAAVAAVTVVSRLARLANLTAGFGADWGLIASDEKVAPREGLEPPTHGLGNLNLRTVSGPTCRPERCAPKSQVLDKESSAEAGLRQEIREAGSRSVGIDWRRWIALLV